MRIRTLILAGSASILAAGLFTACGDGPDDEPTPTLAATTAPTRAATTGANPTVAAGTKIGKKAVDLPSDMVTTATGLKYVDNVVGTGITPKATDVVTVHYVGTNAITGVQFDSSVDRGKSVDFPLNQVIRGFSEGISTMKVGGKRTVLIPAALAYRPYNPADPTSGDLIFEIELIAVK